MAKPSSPITPSPVESPSDSTMSGCLIRIYWILGGYLPVIFCIVGIAQSKQMLSAADAGFFVSIILILLARLVDIQLYRGQTADGKPATMKDFKWFAFWISVGTVLFWLAAHAASYLRL